MITEELRNALLAQGIEPDVTKLNQLAEAITKSATTDGKGLVQLTSALDLDDETLAATAKAIKTLNDKIANVRDEITNFVGEMVKENGGSVSLTNMEKIGFVDDEGVSNVYQPKKIYFDEKGDLLLTLSDEQEDFDETFADITFNEMYDVMTYLFH